MADRVLSDADERKLACMIVLNRQWLGWQADRVATLLMAATMVADEELRVGDVCQAMAMSTSAYYRNMHALRPVAGSETERIAAAAVEQTLREAGVDLDEATTLEQVKARIRSDPSVEMALLGVGVGLSRTEEG